MDSAVTLTQAKRLIEASLQADQPIYLEGAPGIGKTAIVRAIAKARRMPVETLVLSQCDPADVGGVPMRDQGTGALLRLPVGPIRRACDTGCLLFLDEYSCAPPSAQGASLTLVLERWAGDFRLHADTRPILAGNPTDQASGGHDVTLPMVGRVTWIRVRPTLAEVQGYFATLGAEESSLRTLALDLSATWEASPDLLQIDPPAGHVARPAPWGAPRSWERALRLLDAIVMGGEPIEGELAFAGLGGCVGEPLAASYLAIRKVRHNLPTVKEILADPENAKAPKPQANGGLSTEEISSIGLLVQVAAQDACAAWIYGARLSAEITPIVGRTLLRYALPGKAPKKTQAEKARVKILGQIGRDLSAVGGA